MRADGIRWIEHIDVTYTITDIEERENMHVCCSHTHIYIYI